MRNIVTVAENLYNIILDNSDEKFKTLKYQIKKNILESIPFSEPQMINSSWYWNKLSLYINDAITEIDYENINWCKEFIDIFTDKKLTTP